MPSENRSALMKTGDDMNWRIKPLDIMIASAERKSLARTLGAFQLMMLGIGAVIGTGIFVLTAEAAQKAGPGMMVSFVIAGFVCAVTALCYAELASMVPVAGSAYAYSYAVFGEFIAWIVGWALVLEYTIAASAVSVGWSNYFVPLLQHSFDIRIPIYLSRGYFAGGFINVPAVIISTLATGLLVVGTRESATVNAVLVCIKVAALGLFIALCAPVIKLANFHPFAPLGALGVGGAAASVFFAYIGFDAVSTAAEETKNPQRNVPIGLIGSLVICTGFYLLVAGGAIGAAGAQPLMDAAGHALPPGGVKLFEACKNPVRAGALVCSDEPLAHVLRRIGWEKISRLIGLAAFLALPSVILVLIFGQTRIFFSMARDGLLPEILTRVHRRFRTPHVVIMITGAVVTLAAGFFPVGRLADLSNGGTLAAFFAVALAVMILRVTHRTTLRSFETPFVWIVGPLALIGCVTLFALLPRFTILAFFGWALLGLIVYFLYGYRRSALADVDLEVSNVTSRQGVREIQR
jgi:basic amino acid/polyamine antiporter, APA family